MIVPEMLNPTIDNNLSVYSEVLLTEQNVGLQQSCARQILSGATDYRSVVASQALWDQCEVTLRKSEDPYAYRTNVGTLAQYTIIKCNEFLAASQGRLLPVQFSLEHGIKDDDPRISFRNLTTKRTLVCQNSNSLWLMIEPRIIKYSGRLS